MLAATTGASKRLLLYPTKGRNPVFVRLEYENGEPIPGFDWIADQGNILHRYVGSMNSDMPYTGYIDWYSDTSFNNYQMEPFISEWKWIIGLAHEDHVELLSRVLQLARACNDATGWHLKFYGD